MTPVPSLQNIIDATRRRIRRATVIAIVAGAATAIPVAFVVAWLLASWDGWAAPSIAPLAIELVCAAAAGALAFLAVRRWLDPIDEGHVAANTEARLGLAGGALRTIIELERDVPAGTSSALVRRAGALLTPQLQGRSARELAGELGERARRRRTLALSTFGVLVLLVGVLGFGAPERSRASWAPMLSPVAHLSPPPLPALVVTPGATEIARGSDLTVRVRAAGRTAVSVAWRAAGDVPRQHTVEVVGDSAQAVIPRIETATMYWVTAPDGARTERYAITPVDPMLVADLVVEVRPPAYVGRAPERYDTDVPPLEIEEGTRIIVTGRATRVVSAATLEGADASLDLDIDGQRFSGTFVPRVSGTYAWLLRDTQGNAPSLAPTPLEISVIADAAPSVSVTFPGTDTVIASDLRQLIAGDARDDYGLVAATLVSWRVSAQGTRDPALEQPIELGGSEDRALLRAVLDARDRNLLPGDTLKYFVRAIDNSPRRQVGVSPVYALRLPSQDELRDEASRRAASTLEDASQLAAAAQELQRATTELERRAEAANARRGGSSGSPGSSGQQERLGFQEAEDARRVMNEQQAMMDQAEALRERIESMVQAMRAAGLEDAELQNRLQELRDLYDQLLTPEMRAQMEQMREALEQLDPAELEKALEQLAEQQEEMRAQLERSTELLRRAAAEQEMTALSQEARELATQQRALAEELKQDDPRDQTDAQRELAAQSEELAEQMEALREQLEQQGEREAGQKTGDAAEQTRAAGETQQQAAQQAQSGQQQGAQRNAEKAAEQLEQAAQSLDDTRSEMTDGWKREVEESVSQATQEALSLAQRQQALLDQMEAAERDGIQTIKPEMPQMPQPPTPQAQIGKQGEQPQSGEQSGATPQMPQQSGQQQQGGQQQAGGQQQQGGQQQGGQQPGGQQPGGQQPGGQQGGGQQAGGGDVQSMRGEQAALQQGLQQLGRNLTETGERSAMLNREVGSALGRANLSMQQTLEAMEQAAAQQRMPTQEASETVDALNRLALALLENAQQIQQQENGTGMQQALQQLADLAQQQGSLNGQTNALMPMNLSPSAMARELQRMGAQQHSIAQGLDAVSRNVGGRDDVLGDLDALAQAAEQIAAEMNAGRLSPESRARQERLFHRLLDAGRSLERDEETDERVADRPGAFDPSNPGALDARLLDDGLRYRTPTPEELRALPPAYRRLILEYFERLNRASVPGVGGNR